MLSIVPWLSRFAVPLLIVPLVPPIVIPGAIVSRPLALVTWMAPLALVMFTVPLSPGATPSVCVPLKFKSRPPI